MENHILELSRRQSQMGEKVYLLFNQGDLNGLDGHQLMPRIRIFTSRLRVLWTLVFMFKVLLHILPLKKKIEVLHIHGDVYHFWIIKLFNCFFPSSITVASFHGSLAFHPKWKLKLLKYFLKCYDSLYCTGYEATEILRSEGLSCQAIPSGVSDLFYIECKSPVSCDILAVSNLYSVKNLTWVLQLAENNTNRSFTIIGDGPNKPDLINQIQQKKITNVHLVGNKTRQEIAAYMAGANLFIHTSKAEGTPTAVLEAAVAGLPVITSAAGGVQNVQQYFNGTVLNSFDLGIWSDHINVVYDRELRSIEDLSWTARVEEINKIIRS